MIYSTLREANIARAAEWEGAVGVKLDLSFKGVELAGEVGEAIAEIIQGPHAEFPKVADELADVVICCDLIALVYDWHLDPLHDNAWRSFSNKTACIGAYCGNVCNIIKKLERERLGLAGSRALPTELRTALDLLLGGTISLAQAFGINIDRATAAKFNKTSVQRGMKTRMNPLDGVIT